MKRLTHLMTYLVIISSLALLWSCSNDDNTVRQDDTPVRIGIAWRGDSTVIHLRQYAAERARGGSSTRGAADASRFMGYEDALCYFRALVKQGEQIQLKSYRI